MCFGIDFNDSVPTVSRMASIPCLLRPLHAVRPSKLMTIFLSHDQCYEQSAESKKSGIPGCTTNCGRRVANHCIEFMLIAQKRDDFLPANPSFLSDYYLILQTVSIFSLPRATIIIHNLSCCKFFAHCPGKVRFRNIITLSNEQKNAIPYLKHHYRSDSEP